MRSRHLIGIAGALLCHACRAEAPPESPLALSRIAVLARETTVDQSNPGPTDISDAVPLDGSHIALLDYSEARVVVVDTTGRVTARFGRRGGGPGEIQHPVFLVRTQSGVGVVDDLKHALVGFSATGRTLPEIPLHSLIGPLVGRLTGLAQLENGSWVFSVIEKTTGAYREVLYLRGAGASRRLAATPEAPARALRLPCGIRLSPESPVFWPTLRWNAIGTRVAYATTADDRVVVWDAARADSVVFTSDAQPQRSTEAAALAVPIQLRVQAGERACTLTRPDALKQRGMTKVMPVIERLALSSDGTLWTRLTEKLGSVRVHAGGAPVTLATDVFPSFFLSPDRFVVEESDSTGNVLVSLWEVRRRR